MWSLGCVLYIMMTGGMLYDDSNVAATLQKQENRVVDYPEKTVLSKNVDNLIRL